MTNQRALWQSFGLRPDDMTVVDYVEKLAMLQVVAEAERSKRKS